MKPVKIEVRYFLYPKDIKEYSLPCHAKISIYIPCDTNSNELSQYYLSSKELFGVALFADWGLATEIKINDKFLQYRKLNTVISGRDWEMVTQKVEKTVNAAEKLLTEIYEQNKKILETRPNDWEKIICPAEEE